MSDDRIFTASAIARELGRSTLTVTRLVHSGQISPARTTTGAMLFSSSDLKSVRAILSKTNSKNIPTNHE